MCGCQVLARYARGVVVGKLTSLLPALALCGACAQTPAREVMLVANGMSFALADEPENANPALMLRAGERVRRVEPYEPSLEDLYFAVRGRTRA